MTNNDRIEWVIKDAQDTIIGRGKERDLEDGERTIPRCVTAFNSVTGHKLTNTDGWLFMQILKMCRSTQGAYKYDDFRDGIGYAALRAEEARMEHEVSQKLDLRSVSAKPGQIFKLCKHSRLECKECNLVMVPIECDNRSTWTCQHGYTDCNHCIDGEYSPDASPDCDTRGGA